MVSSSTFMVCPVRGLIQMYSGSSQTCMWVCVAIGSLWGRCNNSACAANVSTSGVCTLICSGSPPSSVGSFLSLVLVSEGGAGVCGCDIPTEGDCMVV
jgi:hypothetical protein